MKFYDIITIISLLLTSYMLVTVYMNQNLDERNKKTLFEVYLMLSIMVLCEWLANILESNKIIILLIKYILIITETTIAPIFFIKYANIFLKDAKENEIMNEEILFFPIFFYAMLSTCTYIINIIIYVIIYIESIIYFCKAIILFNKYFQNKDKISLLGIVIIGNIGNIIKFINPELKIGCLCFIISSILIYIYYINTLMYIDNLTELLNQSTYKNRIKHLRKTVMILLLDVDFFKEINDINGHVFGDFILSTIGKDIKKIYGQYGYCYRVGGDEFCVILSDFRKYEKLNNKFFLELEKERKKEPLMPYVSIGCAKHNPKFQDISKSLEEADKDLYYWKEVLKKKRKEAKCE